MRSMAETAPGPPKNGRAVATPPFRTPHASTRVGGGGGFRGGGLGGGDGAGGILVAYLERRKKTKMGERNQGWRRRPWNFAQTPAACWIVPWSGRASPTVRRLGGGLSPSAACAVRGLRTQRWGVGGTPGGTSSTPTCEPACPPPLHDHWRRPQPELCACLASP